MQQQTDGIEDFRRRGNALFALLAAFSRLWRLFFARAGTVGVAEVSSPAAWWSLLIAAAFAAGGRSEVMWVVVLVGIASQAEHRAKSRRSRDAHTMSMGVSNLQRLFGSKARHAEVLTALVAAGACFEGGDVAAAAWFGLSGLGHALTIGFAERRREVTEDQINDARLEMAERSYRRPASRVRKPWEN